MVREIVTIKDYHRLSQEYEHYLWHFVKKNQCESQLIIKPVLSYTCEVDVNPLSIILEATTIPYFESYVEDSFDLPTIYKIVEICAGIKMNIDVAKQDEPAKPKNNDNDNSIIDV